eukprot:XP_016658850.1 PREDICTED: charged multivesicular body protein 1b-like [Acyrthosiphon pisum]
MTLHLDKKIFDLKLAAKQITRSAKKLKKQEAKEIHTCMKHVILGELEIGRAHEENAVRNHNQSLELLTLRARLQGALNILLLRPRGQSSRRWRRDMHLPSLTATMDRFERTTDHLGAPNKSTCSWRGSSTGQGRTSGA